MSKALSAHKRRLRQPVVSVFFTINFRKLEEKVLTWSDPTDRPSFSWLSLRCYHLEIRGNSLFPQPFPHLNKLVKILAAYDRAYPHGSGVRIPCLFQIIKGRMDLPVGPLSSGKYILELFIDVFIFRTTVTLFSDNFLRGFQLYWSVCEEFNFQVKPFMKSIISIMRGYSIGSPPRMMIFFTPIFWA